MGSCICKRITRLQRQINDSTVRGLQAQTTASANKLVPQGEAVVFDEIINDLGGIVSLNPATGVFTANAKCNVLVNYYVNINGAESDVNVSFSINGIKSTATYAVQGQMSGFALLHIEPWTSFSVINSSGQTILLAGSDIQAGIMITTM